MLIYVLSILALVAIISALIFCLLLIALVAQAPVCAGILGGMCILGAMITITISEEYSSSNIVTYDTFFGKSQPPRDYPLLVELDQPPSSLQPI